MKNLIEVIFEEVPLQTLGKFLQELTKTGQHIQNFSWNAEAPLPEELDWQSESAMTNVLKQPSDWAVFIQLTIIKVGSLKLPQVDLRVLHYADKYDVGLLFEWSALTPRHHLVEPLKRFSQTMAKKYEIKNYFAGPEPAEELDTRWFTKPLRTPRNLIFEPIHFSKANQVPVLALPMNRVTPAVKG